MIRCQVAASELNFSDFDIKNEVFFVAPSLKDSKNVYFNGYVPGSEEKWEQWWCKGLRNDHCKNMDEKEIGKYLRGSYHRFFWKNYKMISRNQLFPNYTLVPNSYRLLRI